MEKTEAPTKSRVPLADISNKDKASCLQEVLSIPQKSTRKTIKTLQGTATLPKHLSGSEVITFLEEKKSKREMEEKLKEERRQKREERKKEREEEQKQKEKRREQRDEEKAKRKEIEEKKREEQKRKRGEARKQVANRERNLQERQGSGGVTPVYVQSVREHMMRTVKTQHGLNAVVVHSGSTLVARN